MSTATKERVSAKIWVCKYDCGHRYESPLPISANAHNCSKRNGQNIDSIPEKLSDSGGQSTEKRVASSSTEAPRSEEDTEMATTRAEPKATATKKSAAKAAKTKATPAEATESGEKKGRRSMGGRGWLANEVEKILRKRSTETVSVGEIVKGITNREGEHPSTGAVAAVILRWGSEGYIKVKHERPMSFNGYTAKYKDKTLDAFLDDQKAARAKARAAVKAAAPKG
jgi:hypothetical protein